MKKTIFIKNAIILTVSSLILRFLGIVLKVWLASRIGSEGIGLYQLVFSVYILAATFATSGICTAVTRLIAEEMALGSKGGILKILRRCIELTLAVAFFSVALVFFGANFISVRFLEDIRAAAALKILSFSLPFMGVSSCIRGYFIARRKATPNAASQIFEQLIRIVLVFFLINKFQSRGLAFCCAAVLFADTAAEFLSCGLLYLTFLFDKQKLSFFSGRPRPDYAIVKKILHISLPISGGRYLNTALRTAENILVPKNLAKYKSSSQNALSEFGMIKGMALPVLFFPSSLLNALSTLLIPEISEAATKNQRGIVKSASENILRLTALMGYIFAGLFFVAGKEVGLLIYKSAEVGALLKWLSPIVPLMYLDSVSDGILKGLDQQLFSFRTSVCDSLLRIILILIFLPFSGLKGFIGIMYVSNLLTCALNVGRLIKISGARLKILSEILLPLGAAVSLCTLISNSLKVFVSLPVLVYIIFLCLLSISLYIAFLFLVGSITLDDFRNVIR
ncbi:MAG: oligosaccharide flippase family protein [Clostridia bacterium]|nr:oligosaccharide flippase family protein [Clostridia bacterium]